MTLAIIDKNPNTVNSEKNDMAAMFFLEVKSSPMFLSLI